MRSDFKDTLYFAPFPQPVKELRAAWADPLTSIIQLQSLQVCYTEGSSGGFFVLPFIFSHSLWCIINQPSSERDCSLLPSRNFWTEQLSSWKKKKKVKIYLQIFKCFLERTGRCKVDSRATHEHLFDAWFTSVLLSAVKTKRLINWTREKPHCICYLVLCAAESCWIIECLFGLAS